jgi:putative membrane protein
VSWPAEEREPDPRWSLANERTLLAYNRTALAFLVAGMAVTGSHAVTDAPAWLAALGLPLIAISAVIGISGRRRFVETQHAMRTGQALSPPTIAALVPYAVTAVAIASVVLGVVQLFTE